MTPEERNQVIFQLNFMTGMSMDLLQSMSDDEIKRVYRERVEGRGVK